MQQIPTREKKIIILTVVITGTILLLGVISPNMFAFIADILWTIGFSVAILFLIVGGLTIVGRKKEASAVIDLALEGSLTAIDAIDFVKELFNTFVDILKRVVLIIVPYLSYFFATLIYLLVLIFYKAYGSQNDVVYVTVGITIVMTAVAGLLNMPAAYKSSFMQKSTFLSEVANIFRKHFVDGFEVALLVLFLTIDSESLFFLPSNLNVPIAANIDGYDLMKSGFSTDMATITIKMVMFGLVLEFGRNALRLLAEAVQYYKNPRIYLPEVIGGSRSDLIKATMIKTVQESKDEIMRFTAFTSLMILVFLFFPRLKLLALVVASGTNLVMDVFIPDRLTFRRQDDLLTRVFNKILRINRSPEYDAV